MVMRKMIVTPSLFQVVYIYSRLQTFHELMQKIRSVKYLYLYTCSLFN